MMELLQNLSLVLSLNDVPFPIRYINNCYPEFSISQMTFHFPIQLPGLLLILRGQTRKLIPVYNNSVGTWLVVV